jgi:excisionase family DNA binding protein
VVIVPYIEIQPNPPGGQLGPDLIDVPEAARRLGIHRDTLYRHIRNGEFPPALTLGNRHLVSVPRLQKWLHGGDAEKSS